MVAWLLFSLLQALPVAHPLFRFLLLFWQISCSPSSTLEQSNAEGKGIIAETEPLYQFMEKLSKEEKGKFGHWKVEGETDNALPFPLPYCTF